MQSETHQISVIVPTIGRPESLERLLGSLAVQTSHVHEVVIADSSEREDTALVVANVRWARSGLDVKHIKVHPPDAVRQREVAISASRGALLLMLDDDVELGAVCIEEMLKALNENPSAVAVMADFSNQAWPMPTRLWRLYLRLVHRLKDGEWQGRVIGPLLRFAYNPLPSEVTAIEWLGTSNSLLWRSAFEAVGGFSGFFLHRATTNEDVDLGLKLRRLGPILFCPRARMAHYHDPGGRLSPYLAGEDDIVNRYMILHYTLGKSRTFALWMVLLFIIVETVSALGAMVSTRTLNGWATTRGRVKGFVRAAAGFSNHQSS
jgi:GT2 family glycosyltransferase